MELHTIDYTLNLNRGSREIMKALLEELYREMCKLPYGPERDILQEKYDDLMSIHVTLIFTSTIFAAEKSRREKKKSFLKKLFRK